MSNETYHMVKQFHEAIGQGMPAKPTPIDKETALKRMSWLAEEMVEFLYATVGGNKDEFLQVTFQLLTNFGKSVKQLDEEGGEVDDILTAQADALTDIEYFNQGTFTLMGVEPYNLFKIVQQANMAKMWEIDGKLQPKFRESDGKIVKPPTWEAPEPKIKAEIERQKESFEVNDWITVKEAVEILKYEGIVRNESTVRQWIKNGSLKMVLKNRTKNGHLISEKNLREFIKSMHLHEEIDVLTLSEAFVILKDEGITTDKNNMKRWISEGEIKTFLPNGSKSYRVKLDDLLDFMKKKFPESERERFTKSEFLKNR